MTYTKKDDIEVLIPLLMNIAYLDMVQDFYKLLAHIETYRELSDNKIYLYYYHRAIASFYKHSNNMEQSIEHCLLSNELAHDLNDEDFIIESYRFLSTIYNKNKDFEKAEYYCKMAMEELSLSSDMFLVANVYNLYGVILVNLEEYERAEKAYLNALDTIKKIDEYKSSMIFFLININLAEIYMFLKDDDLSEDYFNRAHKLEEDYQHDYPFTDLLMMMADHHKKNNEFDKACQYYEKYINRYSNLQDIRPKLKSDDSNLQGDLRLLQTLRDTNKLLLRRLTTYQMMHHEKALTTSIEQQLEDDLNKAILNDEIVVFYQHKWSISKNRAIGSEALIRWIKNGIVVPPHAFIGQAEDNSIIMPLSRIVIKKAMKVLKEITATYDPEFVMSVNISPYQLEHQNLLDLIKSELLLNDLEPKNFEIEITERTFQDPSSSSIKQLQDIKALGVRVSLDDFGTGYSSLSSISDFSFDCVKVDRSLVRKSTNDKKANALLSGIVSMLQALSLEIVIEGVENDEEVSLMKKLGCDEIQGYYYSKPVDVEEYLRLINENIGKK
jgi:EAL domain-containing protein (putative c-di-GMP-specific phosphodiesterase class I)/Tfp pilus assembly protein PilF